MAEGFLRQDKRAAVVVNPVKVPDSEFRANVLHLCAEAGWAEPLWLETTEEDPGSGQARQALKEGVDVVMAAGGDGTVRCVAAILAGTGTAMGLVPLGTGNLLARNLGINVADPLKTVKDALAGTESGIDVVRAVLDHGKSEHLFLVAAGLGYDAVIMGDTVEVFKDRVGWLAYVESGIRNLRPSTVTATVTVDGRAATGRKVRSVMVGNCGQLMGGLQIFPGAVVTDGILDLLILATRGRFGWLGVVAGVFKKGRNRHEAVQSLSGRWAEIALDRPQEFELDGDHAGTATHLKVTVDPLALIIRTTAQPT